MRSRSEIGVAGSLVAGALGVLAYSTHAQAQESSGTLQEVVVTAQKRSERLQDVPVTISAFNPEAILAPGPVRIDAVSRLTPGVYMGSYSTTRPQLYIRGVGSRQFDLGADPSVGLFVDEVYVGRFSAAMAGLVDIERIELLKGPQGTLYGRNTIGGAVSVVTARPSATPTGYVEAGGGDYNTFYLKGNVSGPVAGDRLLASLGAVISNRDGYAKNLATGATARGEDFKAFQGKLLWRAADNLSFTLTGRASRDGEPGQQGKTEGPSIFLISPAAVRPAPVAGKDKDYYTYDPVLLRNVYSLSLRSELDLGGATATAISAWQNGKVDELVDLDALRLDINRNAVTERAREYAQELRLSSNPNGPMTFGGRGEWLLGVYGYWDKGQRSDAFVSGPDSLPVFAANVFAPPFARRQFISNTTILDKKGDSYAIFGQYRYDITEQLSAIVGLRYTRDHKQGTYYGITDTPGNQVIAANFALPLERSWDSLDPKLTLQYKFSPDAMVFASYNHGYKSGGFQYQVTDSALARQIFNPEKVDYYEVGLKSQWFERRVTLNASAFYNDYKDLQVAQIVVNAAGSPSAFTTNAATSTIKGAEIELGWRPTRAFDVLFGYAYLDAEYDKFPFSATQDFSGTRMVRSPKHTATLAANYTVFDVAGGQITFRGASSYSSSFFFEPGEGRLRPETREPGYIVTDFRVTYDHGPWSLSAFVNNAFDERYRNSLVLYPVVTSPDFSRPFVNGRPTAFTTNPGQVVGFWSAPRLAGVTLTYRLR